MRRLEFIWAHHLRDRPFVLDVVQLVTLMVLRAVSLRLWTRHPFVLDRYVRLNPTWIGSDVSLALVLADDVLDPETVRMAMPEIPRDPRT